MRDVLRWWRHVLWVNIRDMWDSLPGPWFVKVALILVCQVIPGPLDEIALLAVIGAWRRYRNT